MTDQEIEKFTLNEMNEYIFEIRYKPNSKILDYRGEWAEQLSKMLSLPQWRISENRIDAYNHEKDIDQADERGFISFRNAGYVLRNSPSEPSFFKRVEPLLKFIYEKKEVFGKKIFIDRIGAKTRFGNAFSGSFTTLLNLYLERYLIPNKSILDIFDVQVVDVGGFMKFQTNDGMKMNTLAGPMEGDQLQKFFPFLEKPVEPILYFEIDSFVEPHDELDLFAVKKIVDDLIRNNWSKNNKIVRQISGE